MAKLQTLVVTVILSLVAAASADVILSNNAYSGIVVALDPNADPPSTIEEEQEIANRIQDLITKTSAAVFEATESRAYFSEVTIILPETWTLEAERSASGKWETWRHSSIRMVTTGRHNNAPRALPGGQCGVSGPRIEVSLEYLTDDTIQAVYGDVGLAMTAEWLKYRYGVYEEHGYPGDSFYPHAYFDVERNITLPTGCTDQDTLVGRWQNMDGEECDVTAGEANKVDPDCRFVVEDTEADYSLLYISHIPKVRHVCNADTHDPSAPTPQNKRCNGKSVWEVMMQHKDFSDGKNPPDTSGPDTTPLFHLVKMTTPALYLLLDDTCGRKSDAEGECFGLEMYKALEKPLSQILKSSIPRIGLRRYMYLKSLLYENTALIPTGNIDEADFFSNLPLAINDKNHTKSEEALVEALKDIANSDYEGDVNILFIQLIFTEEDGSQYTPFLVDDVTVTGLVYGDIAHNPWMSTLTQQTNGAFTFNPDYDPNVAQDILFNMILPDFSIITLLHTQVSLVEETTASVEVLVDETVGSTLMFTVTFSESDGTMVITDPSGADMPEGKTDFENAMQGKWRLTLTNTHHGSADVTVTSQQRPGLEEVEIVTWTSASGTGEVDLETKGLILYASVTQGNVGIKDLDVTAICRAGGAGTASIEVKLNDNGHGDPDMQLHDGVYSAYVTDFGSLEIIDDDIFVDVMVNPGSSSVDSSQQGTKTRNAVTVNPFEEEPCCGSVAGDAIVLPVNRYTTSATSAAIINGPGTEPYNPPPSQITNIEVTNVDQEGPSILAGSILVSLKWSAPGKDFTSGKVSDYQVWYSDSKVFISAGLGDGTLVKDDEYEGGKPVPVEYGSEQSATVRLPKRVEETTHYYIVVIGIDGNQQGPSSPLVGVTVTAGEPYITVSTTMQSSTSTKSTTQATTPTGSAGTTETQDPTEPPKGFVGTPGFYVLIGVGSGVIVVAVIASVYCYRKRNPSSLSSTKKLHETNAYDAVDLSRNGEMPGTLDVEKGISISVPDSETPQKAVTETLQTKSDTPSTTSKTLPTVPETTPTKETPETTTATIAPETPATNTETSQSAPLLETPQKAVTETLHKKYEIPTMTTETQPTMQATTPVKGTPETTTATIATETPTTDTEITQSAPFSETPLKAVTETLQTMSETPTMTTETSPIVQETTPTKGTPETTTATITPETPSIDTETSQSAPLAETPQNAVTETLQTKSVTTTPATERPPAVQEMSPTKGTPETTTATLTPETPATNTETSQSSCSSEMPQKAVTETLQTKSETPTMTTETSPIVQETTPTKGTPETTTATITPETPSINTETSQSAPLAETPQNAATETLQTKSVTTTAATERPPAVQEMSPTKGTPETTTATLTPETPATNTETSQSSCSSEMPQKAVTETLPTKSETPTTTTETPPIMQETTKRTPETTTARNRIGKKKNTLFSRFINK